MIEINEKLLEGSRIWLSGAIPKSAPEEDKGKIRNFIRAFAKEVFRRNGRIIHGCQPDITPILIEAAEDYERCHEGQPEDARRAGLVLCVSRFFSKAPEGNNIDLAKWNKHCCDPVIETREGLDMDTSLEILRETLVEQSNVMVAIGGRKYDTALKFAGVINETDMAAKAGIPAFFLGGFGGAMGKHISARQEILQNCRNGLSEQANLSLSEEAVGDQPDKLAKSICSQIALLPVSYRDPSSGRPFRILCLDGGGIKGTFAAAALAYFERQSEKRIVDHFDLIAGTSTGGILAIGLGLGLRPDDLLDFYRQSGPSIFPTEDKLDRLWHSFRHWFSSAYDQNVLKQALKEAYSKAGEECKTLDESKCRILIPTYDAKVGRPFIFRTPHAPFENSDKNRDPVTVALATAAAPTYFDSVPTLGTVAEIEAIDGGIWANNPTLAAITEATMHLRVPLQRIEVLSIGTSFSPGTRAQPFQVNSQVIKNVLGLTKLSKILTMTAGLVWKDFKIRGKLGWVSCIADLLMEAQTQSIDHGMKGLLQERYHRIDSPSNIQGLDDVTAIGELAGLGEQAAQEYLSVVKNRFLNGVPVDEWISD